MISFKPIAATLLALSCALSVRAQEDHVIKFATLAPESSTWGKVLTELSVDLEKETGGKLKFKFYWDGRSGDEKDVVKKIRIGQLQAAGFTGVGLGDIAPSARLLDAPWLFRDHAELVAIRRRFDKDLSAAVEKNGFVVLGWTDIGSVYVFSKNPILEPEDMRRQKMWVWEGDPIAEAAYQALAVSPVPLSVLDVMQSLQTGMIDGFYGPPLAVVALQWFQRAKHIYPVPMAESTGAVLIAKKFFDALPPVQREMLVKISAKHLRRLNELTEVDNARALAALQKQGLLVGPAPTPAVLRKFEDLGRTARHALTERTIDAGLLDKVERELATLRARKTTKG